MAIETVKRSLGTTASAGIKNIAVSGTAANGIQYVVPSGRQFKGVISSNYSQDSKVPVANVNGAEIFNWSSAQALSVNLGPDAIVTPYASYEVSIIGIEFDA